MINAFKIKLPVLLFLMMVSILLKNSLQIFLSLIVLIIILKLLDRRNEPPIFIFLIIYHWIQITIKVFYASFLNLDVQNIYLSNHSKEAFYLSIISLFTFSLGVFLFFKRKKKQEKFYNSVFTLKHYSILKLFYFYLFMLVCSFFLQGILTDQIINVGIFAQFIKGFLIFKYASIYVVFLTGFIQKKYKILLYVFLIEFLVGSFSFFSNFKEPFIILFLAYFTVHSINNFRRIIKFLPIALILIFFGLLWSSFKSDYRQLINKNNNTMIVNVSFDQQKDILLSSIAKVEYTDIVNSIEIIVNRISYIDYFGYTIANVPYSVKHENGKLWYGAFTNFLKPRILFPNKEVLDDSIRTQKYTGVKFANLSDGASISLGYYAESYIDFGYFMIFFMFFLGLFFGFVYVFFASKNIHFILRFSYLLMIFSSAYLFETRNDKLIGSIFFNMFFIYLYWRLIFNFIYNMFFSQRINKFT